MCSCKKSNRLPAGLAADRLARARPGSGMAAAARMDFAPGPAAITRGDAPYSEGSERSQLRSRSLAFSAIISVGALVLPEIIVGMIEASTT